MLIGRAKPVLRWIFATLFGIEGINLMIPGHDIQAYVKWGYPWWLHIVVEASLLSTSILLLFRRLRGIGASIGCCFLVLETAATALHHDYAHAIQGPIFVILLLWLASPTGDRGQPAL